MVTKPFLWNYSFQVSWGSLLLRPEALAWMPGSSTPHSAKQWLPSLEVQSFALHQIGWERQTGLPLQWNHATVPEGLSGKQTPENGNEILWSRRITVNLHFRMQWVFDRFKYVQQIIRWLLSNHPKRFSGLSCTEMPRVASPSLVTWSNSSQSLATASARLSLPLLPRRSVFWVALKSKQKAKIQELQKGSKRPKHSKMSEVYSGSCKYASLWQKKTMDKRNTRSQAVDINMSLNLDPRCVTDRTKDETTSAWIACTCMSSDAKAPRLSHQKSPVFQCSLQLAVWYLSDIWYLSSFQTAGCQREVSLNGGGVSDST